MTLTTLLISAAMAFQQQASLDQAARRLAAGDTARALKIIRSEAKVSDRMTPEALRANLALLWIGRDRSLSSEKRRWRITAGRLRSGSDRGDPAVILVNTYLIDRDDRVLPDSLTRRAVLTTTARVLQNSPEGSVTNSAAHWVMAEYFLVSADRAFVSRIPAISDPPIDCDERSPVCFAREPVLGRALAVEDAPERIPELGAALDSAIFHLGLAATGPWPLNEMALRTLTALRWIFSSTAGRLDLIRTIRESELPPSMKHRLTSTLFEAAGMRDSSWAVMSAHPEDFKELDEDVAVLRKAKRLSTPAFWRTGRPFFLDPYNERLVAHRNRLIAAEQLLHMLPQSRVIFGLSDIQRRLVRLGLPKGVAVYKPVPDPDAAFKSTRAKLIWYLDVGLHETLLRGGAIGRLTADLDLGLAARSIDRGRSISGFKAEEYSVMQHFSHQVVQFFRDGHPEVDIFAEIPDGRCEESLPRIGLFVLNSRLGLIRRAIDTVTTRLSRRLVYKLNLDPGAYVYSLELLDPGCNSSRRARYVVSVRADTSDAMQASDLALVREVDIDQPVRVTGEIRIVPKTELHAPAGEPLKLYWEVYGIDSDSLEQERFQIKLNLVNVDPDRVSVDQLGRVARKAHRAKPNTIVKYDAPSPAGTGPIGMALTVDIPKGSVGIHVLRLEIKDRKTGKKAFIQRAIYIEGMNS